MQLYTYGLQIREHLNMLYGTQNLDQIERFGELLAWFKKSFKKSGCFLASSSGRVELVGNHTDHNGGSVLACTVNKDIIAAFLPRKDGKIILKSHGYKDIRLSLNKPLKHETNSRGLTAGVLHGFLLRGFAVGGFEACISSNVPNGAGMSSSAAFELLIAQIENHLYNDGKISAKDLSEIGQYAENVFFNKPCGLLDQSVIAFGGTVELDFKDGVSVKFAENKIESLNLIVIESGGSHANLVGHYAAIPNEMKSVAGFFKKQRLCEVDKNLFDESLDMISKTLGNRPCLRAKHFFEENQRVKKAVSALQNGDADGFIEALNESGQSSRFLLQNCDFEGSDGKLPFALDFVKSINQDGAVRVHGGGFAGTILSVVKNESLPSFLESAAGVFDASKIHLLKIRQSGAVVL